MGKNKKKKTEREQEDNDNDDEMNEVASIASSQAMDRRAVSVAGDAPDSDNDNEHEEVIEDPVPLIIEKLNEKRYTTREDALSKLLQLLVQSYRPDIAEEYGDTIELAASRGLKKGSKTEAILCASLLAVVGFNLSGGTDNERYFSNCNAGLLLTLKNHRDADVRSQCALAYGVLAFLGSPDGESTCDSMRLMAEYFANSAEAHQVRAATLESWGLLASVVRRSFIFNEGRCDHELIMIDLLSHEDLEVRISAGECLALVSSFEWNAKESGTSEDYVPLLAKRRDVIELLEALATDADRRKAKKERCAQRAAFRAFLKTLESGEVPTEILKVGATRPEIITLNGWIRLKQLNTMRRYLGEGLHRHLLANPLIRQIFNLPPAAKAEKMDKLEKELYLRDAKDRAKEEYHARSKKRAQKNELRHGEVGYDD